MVWLYVGMQIGSSISPPHVPLYEAWSLMEMRYGEPGRAKEILLQLEGQGCHDSDARVVVLNDDFTGVVLGFDLDHDWDNMLVEDHGEFYGIQEQEREQEALDSSK